MNSLVFVSAVLSLVVFCEATRVNQCPNAKIEGLEKKVQIGNCNKPPCRLRKNTKVPLILKFQPAAEMKNLTQTVNANILGIAFPFIGVDGTSACDKVYEEDEKTKNNCQFEKGKTYVFKDAIDVLQVYPTLKTVVHWSLTDSTTKKDAICFEVPARITN
ncbi:NPC intracellular cholesterol transporter 2 isoform X3 [Anthonomus grandis grandis]|uniref:NPC intracellular cholesterol transporter 2 isoform X3 n=1 Tax=Anthonomus grandis grandis TaxID=2921223 RepID=UPI0021653D6D|nr:NPC intracellular cholesterol transporter 2 isoform X3 [Anthonomus grandis grandis]